jgi:predicted Zn-dependent peptidase
VGRRLDEIIAQFIAQGPTEDEVRRVVMRDVSGRIQGLEQVGGFGGKAVALAEGALYADDPELYKKQMLALGRVTPAQVQTAMRKWLTRPVYALTVVPGERQAYEEAAASKGSAASQRPRFYREPEAGEQPLAPHPVAQRPMPQVGTIAELDFPAIERATLSNGIPVTYARRDTVPVVRVAVEFDAGIAADPATRLGTQSLMLDLLEEGTTSLNSIQLAEAEERLGANIGAGASLDRTAVSMTALTPNLGPSLDLLADVIRNPAFDPGEIERLRAQQLAEIAAELTEPNAIARRALPTILYGVNHPYGKPFTGTGDPAAVRAVTREDLVAFHQQWIRPDSAHIFAVGDVPLAELVRQLETRFGNWAPPAVPKGVKNFSAAVPPSRARIVLIDRPQSPQSLIYAGSVLPVRGTDDVLTLQAANEVIGGNFLARINMDLRETKGWSYGARTSVNLLEQQVPFLVSAPVQADKTGPAIAAILDQLKGFSTTKGVTAPELAQVINGNTRQLAGSFETSGALLGALRSMALYRRPDDYYERIADRYRALTPPAIDQTARQLIDPAKIVWVVVGDAAKVRPQLDALGIPVEVMQPR